MRTGNRVEGPETGRVRYLREEPCSGPLPLFVHPEWAERFPWLVQGTTARGTADEFDLRLSGQLSVSVVLGRWHLLRETLRLPRVVHARQVHGTQLLCHPTGEPPGIFLGDAADGHATLAPGVLLTVSAADCIPISIVDPKRRAIALLHGGWRGVAAGIIEEGVTMLREVAGSDPAELFLHLGPAICGACYEVGPEVHTALGLRTPRGNRPIDLRVIAARRAELLGVPAERITISTYCTRCSGSPFFSHRAGSNGRQVGVLGVRPELMDRGQAEIGAPEARP